MVLLVKANSNLTGSKPLVKHVLVGLQSFVKGAMREMGNCTEGVFTLAVAGFEVKTVPRFSRAKPETVASG